MASINDLDYVRDNDNDYVYDLDFDEVEENVEIIDQENERDIRNYDVFEEHNYAKRPRFVDDSPSQGSLNLDAEVAGPSRISDSQFEERRLEYLRKKSERERMRWQNMSQESRNVRLEQMRNRNFNVIADESVVQRQMRLEQMRNRNCVAIADESVEQRQMRLEQMRNRNCVAITDESAEQRQFRLEEMRNRNCNTIADESMLERQLRLDQQRIRQRVIRQGVVNVYAAGSHENANEHRLSQMNMRCEFCDALHFVEEKVNGRGNSFKDCCHYGKVFVPEIPEQDFPEELRDLFMKFDARHRNFFENIRHLNSSVSFASMNPLRYRYPNNRGPYCFRIYGQVYHKMNLALNPEDGDDPAYGQIFIVDTEHAMRAMRHANAGIDPQLLRTAYEVIRNVNPFAEAYMMMKEEEEDEVERARNENREPAEIKLLFETGRQLDRRLGYNVPRANEVAAVYVPGADGEVPNAKIVVRERGKELKILSSTNSMVTPMTYPLFYPRGTIGWHPEMKQRNSNRRVTRLQYVCYTLAIREREFNPILYGGKLFQQYCVDEYVKIEGDRMNWIKCNQKKILADAYKNVDNMLMRRAQERGLPLGRKVILPPSVTNSPRYVEKHFQDAMAVVRRFGKPDMFLTMTCNPQWGEISENLFHEQTSSDRPDLVIRVFNLKVKAIMNEIAKKKIFGEVIAWMYPVENQGRGLPHIHLLLTEIALGIMKAGKTLADFPTMEQINVDDDVEQLFDLAEELDLGQRNYALMYDEQRNVCDAILHRIWNPVKEPAFYFLSGPGGTGKTHVNKTIVHMLRGQKKKVCTMAFTGIAATLLPAGRTLHNRFGLALDMSNSNVGPRSKAWQELKETDLFICDEAPMINKRAMRTLDEKLREIMNNRIEFGGKVMLWTGDFRQTLPIQRHATRAEVVNSTLKRSEYWRLAKRYKLTKNMRALETEQEFAKDLLEIGSGKWNSESDEIILPENCISYGDLAEEIFANCIASENWNEMAKSAILAPKNIDVSEMNNRVLDMLPGEEFVYTSIDLAQDENRQRVDEYLDEYLNALNPSGFPRHKLRLKKNAIVLLMRNLNIEMGLCNGSRMKVEEMHPNLIMCKILTGDKAGQTVYIPRITLCCSDDYPFDLHRHQFPLVLAFAMTINKAQGQTLEQVGIDLRKDVFSHGQLYVALSRARAWNKLRIRLDDSNLERKVKNVVYNELLDNSD